MTIAVQTDSPPLRPDSDGGLRIGGTRVLLELVIRAFQDGATPEAIVQRYPTLALADVYAVIAYFLRHRDDVEQYLAEREAKADEVRRTIDARQGDLTELRERLISRHGD
jgi:uncharacterized protein (DUF433 family)